MDILSHVEAKENGRDDNDERNEDDDERGGEEHVEEDKTGENEY